MPIRSKLIAVLAVTLLGFFPDVAQARDFLVVSVADQKMALLKGNTLEAIYVISTSKYGVGDSVGSYKTPLGKFQIYRKIGGNKPPGAVFKSRQWTGEIVRPNAPDRDPIVTRILWLKGLESQNRRALDRGIYIHGTPQESALGTAASYGCIRMRSADIIRVFNQVDENTGILITRDSLVSAVAKCGGVAEEEDDSYASR
ncbi:MAG: L,D-transpeptidase [Verrucomicrobiae bacterium]|nr:L,D-transpeptidase [Verrucomicrobiae bacterium]